MPLVLKMLRGMYGGEKELKRRDVNKKVPQPQQNPPLLSCQLMMVPAHLQLPGVRYSILVGSWLQNDYIYWWIVLQAAATSVSVADMTLREIYNDSDASHESPNDPSQVPSEESLSSESNAVDAVSSSGSESGSLQNTRGDGSMISPRSTASDSSSQGDSSSDSVSQNQQREGMGREGDEHHGNDESDDGEGNDHSSDDESLNYVRWEIHSY